MQQKPYEAPRVEPICVEPINSILEVSPTGSGSGSSGENAGDENQPGF